MRKEYGEWTPDLYELIGAQNLRVAKNVLPKVGGYEPWPSLSNINTQTLPFAPRGAIRGVRRGGTNVFFAAVEDTSTNSMELYQFRDSGGTNVWVDVSSSTETYGTIRKRRVEFAQLGTSIFAASYSSATQGFNLESSTEFASVAPTCPRASHAVVAGGQLILGELFTSDAGAVPNGVAWSGLNAPYSWPVPGTDAATALLSGRNPLEGNGGRVQGLVAGSEVVAVFQENAIWRMDFIGNDAVWAFNDVVTDHGLLIKGAAAPFQRGVFYIADDGFRIFDYTNSRSIGKGKVDQWFRDEYDSDFPDSVSVARDPKRTQIRMSFASQGNAGVPNRVLIYDWALDRFTYGEEAVYTMIGAGTSPNSLDSPDIPGDQNTLEGTTPTYDQNYGVLSFDDRQSGTFERTIGGFDSSFRLSTSTGANLSGELETGYIEPNPGRRTVLQGVRSHIRGEGVSMQIAPVGDETLALPHALDFGVPIERQRDGMHYKDLDSRYLSLRFNLGTNWSEASFWDMEHRPGGKV